jgi:cell division protein FtsW
VVTNTVPNTGISLPFFSYGGTNLLCAFFAVGTILSVGIHSYRDKRTAFVRKVLAR